MKKISSTLKYVLTAIAVTALSVATMSSKVDSVQQGGDDNSLLGAGATFPYPFYSKLFSEYNKAKGLQVNYQSIGSGGGILQLTNKTVDFGASDAFLNDEETKKLGVPAVHIPMVSGAVVITYNLPGVTGNLKLTPAIIADIFLGKITKWDDARIKAANKGVNIPALPVIVAHRSDGSGTTSIFTDYLAKVSTEWNTKVGKGKSVNWPVGLGAKGNEGVAGLVKQNPGTVGYVELIYVLQNKMEYAQVQNQKGVFVLPSLVSTKAAGNVKLPEDAKINLSNTDAKDGYPIAGLTWIIIYKEQNYGGRSAARAKKLLDLLWWSTHEGQKYAEPLNYAPLSDKAVKLDEKILKSVTYNGKPILK